MALQHQMKSFWWFIDGRVGGMGRPGFNRCHWFDLSLEEGVVLSWLGKQQQAIVALADLWQHLDGYGPKVSGFYGLSTAEGQRRLRRLQEPRALQDVLAAIHAKTHSFQDMTWLHDAAQPALRITASTQRRQHELALLKQQNVSVVITLTEQPFDHAELAADFGVYHVPVEDVTPPTYAQVYAVADILASTLAADKNIVVHCLAGIGRTTTMLIAAYVVQGYPLPALLTQVQRQNPHFLFQGSQATFLQTLADAVQQGQLPVRRCEEGSVSCPSP